MSFSKLALNPVWNSELFSGLRFYIVAFFLQYYIRCNTHTYKSALEPDWGQYCWYAHAEIRAHTWFVDYKSQYLSDNDLPENQLTKTGFIVTKGIHVSKKHHKFKVSSKIINVFITCTPWANFLHFSYLLAYKSRWNTFYLLKQDMLFSFGFLFWTITFFVVFFFSYIFCGFQGFTSLHLSFRSPCVSS